MTPTEIKILSRFLYATIIGLFLLASGVFTSANAMPVGSRDDIQVFALATEHSQHAMTLAHNGHTQ